MHRVLAALQTILRDEMPSNYRIKRIQIGSTENDYNGLMMYGDFPSVLITPNGQPTSVPGPWANHQTTTYRIFLYAIMLNENPNTSRVQRGLYNQGKTLSEVTEKMKQVLGNNKKLRVDGQDTVRTWSTLWRVTGLEDKDGRQIRQVESEWIDDLVPWDGAINNQTNIKPSLV